MIVCAVGLVLVAPGASGSVRPAPVRNGRWASRHPGGGARQTPHIAPNTVVHWIAMNATGTDRRWLEEIAATLPSCQLTVLDLSNATIDGIRAACANHLGGVVPDIVSFQAGLEDLLDGAKIEPFKAALAALCDELADRDAVVLIGNVPDLSRLAGRIDGGIAVDGLRRVVAEWNRAIWSISKRHGANLVDLSEEMVAASTGQGESIGLDPADLAARFGPSVRAAAGNARAFARRDA